MIKYLFADRDGTLIFDKHYLCDPEQVELIPGTGNSLYLLRNNAIKIFIVTNQSGIGRGYFTEKELAACQKKLEDELRKFGVSVEDTAYCPHGPDEECSCRKPNLGMWDYLSAKHGLNPAECAMIGDKKEDVLFGIKAGFAYSCLVLTGKGEKTAKDCHIPCGPNLTEFSSSVFGLEQDRTKCFVSHSLNEFVQFLLKSPNR